MPELITSAANPLVKRVRALADRKARRREGAFVVEGVTPVWRALEAGREIETMLVARDLVAGTAAQRLVAEAADRGIQIAGLSAELFGRLSGKDGPAGVLAVVRSDGPVALDDLRLPADAVVVALHEVATPGNLGTIVRAADAAGAAAVVTVGPSTDPFAPRAVKASMGSLFAVATAHATSLDEFFGWAARQGLRVATTSARATTAHWDADWSPPVALLLGSEGEGLTPETVARGDLQVRIPMTGTATSLNLAVAAGVLLFELRRPRGSLPG